jgi:sugar lactone lactonase YvrE
VTFSVVASGSPAPTYQWKKGTANIAGATSASYAIASAAATDAGSYTVVATNSAGSVTSAAATLTVNPTAAAPTITTQPASQTVTAGSSVTFSVAASGSPTPTFQWQKGGVNIPGATTSSYTIASAVAGDADIYTAVATNSAGSTTSNAATLTITRATTTPAQASANMLLYPASICGDASGNIYVADASNDTIHKITPAGMVSTLAGTAGVAGTQNGPGSTALFNQPDGVAIDGAGNLYVADSGNATIRKITPDGIVSTLAGSAGGRGNQDGTGGAASFSSPVGLAVDGAGNLYVADPFNATIRKITPAGAVSTLAGSPANRGDADGTGAAARFNYPNDVAVDTAGNVFVADTYNDTIRKITPTGVVTTLAGSAGISGAVDLTGRSALFNQPYGLAVDGAGNVFVADTGNGTIRRISPGGAVSTVAGMAGVAGFGDGIGSRALFNQPHSLWVDATGNIFVVDSGNAALRRIAADGTVTTPALTAAPSAGSSPPPMGGTTTPAGTGVASASGGGTMQIWFVGLLTLLMAARRMVRPK